MLARANSVCLLALARSDRRVLALPLVRVDCAVLCWRSKENKEIQEASPTNDIIVGNYRPRRPERWERIPTMFSEVCEIQVRLCTT